VGQVINLGSTTLSDTAIQAAMRGNFITANDTLDVASNTASYLFAFGDQNIANSTITDTLTNFQNVIGSDGVDYIRGSDTGNVITGGARADYLSGGNGTDIYVYTTNASSAGTNGVNMDAIGSTIDFAQGDRIMLTFSTGNAADSTTGIASNGATVGTMATDIDAGLSRVDTIADVYAALGTFLNTMTASTASASGTVAQVVRFNLGSYNGKFLVINDGIQGFQAANDVVIDYQGGFTLNNTIFAYDYIS
jgi:hypothetical protein